IAHEPSCGDAIPQARSSIWLSMARDLAKPAIVLAAECLHVARLHQRPERLLVLHLVHGHVAELVLAHDGLEAPRARGSREAQELRAVLVVVPAVERGFLLAGDGRLDDEEHRGHEASSDRGLTPAPESPRTWIRMPLRMPRGDGNLRKVIAGDMEMHVVARLGLERDLARAVEHHGVDLLQPLDHRR